jgi:hypothetical protein
MGGDYYSPSTTTSDSTSLSKVHLYMNTIVFSTVSAIVIFILLALMLRGQSSALKEYTPFIITLQVGLLIIVFYALYSVLVFESKLKKNHKELMSGKRRSNVLSCPDYWTLNEDGKGSRVCERRYVIPGGFITMPGATNKVNMNEYDMKPMKDVCKKLPKTLKTSWSSLKAECDAYAYN